MEQALRCNALKCRKELIDRALVTTCSHIFCLGCASRLGLTSESRRASCPACYGQLLDPDDAVITNLKPTEDYKTSVLSGLSPNIVMECAGRALSFWAYQMTQEICYQEYVGKTLTDKFTSMKESYDKDIKEAHSEINELVRKFTNLSIEHDNLRRKNEDLAQAYNEKTKKLLQTQELYDKLYERSKRRAMMGQLQDAALDTTDTAIQAAAMASNSISDQLVNPGLHGQQVTSPQNIFYGTDRSEQQYGSASYPRGVASQLPGAHWRAHTNSQDVPNTPSTHRQRLAPVGNLGLSTVPGLVRAPSRTPRPMNSFEAPSNGPFGSDITRQIPLPSQHHPHERPVPFSGPGLSSGVKSGHSLGFMAPPARPAVAIQRPIPVASQFGNA